MTTRGLVALAVVAACSKGPQSSVTATSKDAAAPVASGDATKPDERGPKMSDDAVIKAHYKQHGWGEPAQIKLSPRVPGMYDVDGESQVLVHDGKVVEGGGLAAFASYLKTTRLAPKPPLEVKDMLELVAAFDAYPDTKAYNSQAYYNNPRHKELNPKLAFDDKGGHLVLHYWIPAPKGPAPQFARVVRATLDLGGDGTAAWREEEVKFDTSKP